MTVREQLTNMEMDYEAMLDDIARNMYSELFDNESVGYLEIVCPSTTEAPYTLIPSEGNLIYKTFYNGTKTISIDFDIALADAHSVTWVDADDTEEVRYARMGIDYIIETAVTPVLLKILYVDKSADKLSTEMYNEFLNLIFFLTLQDTQNVFVTFRRLQTMTYNVSMENKNTAPIHKMQIGKVTPWGL